uniref:Retrotransposon Copia-like N-terminal domain-containing protein n=1 Tax=Manihot esculenta TaxID=3983 RepID=A0A2C9UGZ6_MANES
MAATAANIAQTSNAIPTQNTSSPYFLHPNENPALILVSPALTGLNCHSWARVMRVALLSKKKLKYIDGSLRAPSVDDPLFPA